MISSGCTKLPGSRMLETDPWSNFLQERDLFLSITTQDWKSEALVWLWYLDRKLNRRKRGKIFCERWFSFVEVDHGIHRNVMPNLGYNQVELQSIKSATMVCICCTRLDSWLAYFSIHCNWVCISGLLDHGLYTDGSFDTLTVIISFVNTLKMKYHNFPYLSCK